MKKPVLVLLGLLSVAACDDDATGPDAIARLRFLHAAQGTAQALLRADGATASTAIAFGDAPSTYQDVASGSRALAVRLPNATTDLATLTATLKTSDAYTALFVKRAAGVGLVLLADTNTAPAAGKVRFRFVNAARAGNLDVYVTAANADLATATPVSAAIEPEKAGTYVSVDAGTYRIRFTNAGTKTVVLDLAAAAFAQGQVRTITVIEAAAGGAPLRGVVSADRG